MGMSYEELEQALVRQSKVNVDQRAEIERLTRERDALRAPFRAVDDQDWEYIMERGWLWWPRSLLAQRAI